MSKSNFNNALIPVPVDDIVVGAHIKNIRQKFDEQKIRELSEAILREGLSTPLTVMSAEDENGISIIELVAGERRLRAIQYIREKVDKKFLDEGIPCVEYVGTLKDAKFVNASENIDREDIDDVDIAAWLSGQTAEGTSQTELAQKLHRSNQWVSFRVTFHERACDELKAAVQEGLISFTAAYELSKNIKDKDEQAKRVKKARLFGEKISLEQAQRANNKNKTRRPGKKDVERMTAEAEKHESDFSKGLAFGLRWIQGLNTEDDLMQMLAMALAGRGIKLPEKKAVKGAPKKVAVPARKLTPPPPKAGLAKKATTPPKPPMKGGKPAVKAPVTKRPLPKVKKK